MGSEEGVLILTDVFGASPCKASMACFRPEVAEKIKFISITDMNMSIALEALTNRGFMSLEELADLLLLAGK